LVISMATEGRTADEAAAAIAGRPEFRVGSRQGQRLPAVLDTPDAETDRRCWRWLRGLPGVAHVDVVFIHFEDARPATPLETCP
jgi:hypothetical protein